MRTRWVWARRLRANHHDAAGVLVEAMDDAGARQIDRLGIAVQQRILQGAVSNARPRMHGEARWLVDDGQIRVFIQHVESDRLRALALGLVVQWLRVEIDLIASRHRHTRTRRHRPIDAQSPGLYPGLQTGAGIVWEELGCDRIQASAGKPFRHLGCLRYTPRLLH